MILLQILSRKKVFGHLSTSKRTLFDETIIKTIRVSESTRKDLSFDTNLVFVSLTVQKWHRFKDDIAFSKMKKKMDIVCLCTRYRHRAQSKVISSRFSYFLHFFHYTQWKLLQKSICLRPMSFMQFKPFRNDIHSKMTYQRKERATSIEGLKKIVGKVW